MSLGVADTWQPAASEWDDIWRNCPYATYFHGREWAQIWRAYTGGKIAPYPVGIVFSDGARVILPLSRQTVIKGCARRFLWSPASTYGGWIGRAPLSATHQTALAKWIGQNCADLIWRLNPYEPMLAPVPGATVSKDETHCLDLANGFDVIERGWTQGGAAAARKARKARDAGIEISLAETEADWRGYFGVYRESIARWGERTTSNYAWPLFDALLKRTSPHIRLWLATHEHTIVAGALCLYSPVHVAYWHGAALSEHFRNRPVNLLMQEAIRDACARGMRWFDFNPSGGLDGVKAFKRSFGALPLASDLVTTTSLRMRLLAAAARLRARKTK